MQIKNILYIAVLFIITLVSSCSTVAVHTYMLEDGYKPFPPTDRHRIQFIDSIDSIKTKYASIAVLNVTAHALGANGQIMMDKLIDKASEVGANAIYIKGFNKATNDQLANDLLLNQGIATNRLSAIALYIYSDEDSIRSLIKVFKKEPENSKYIGTVTVTANTKAYPASVIANAKILANRLNGSFIVPVGNTLDHIRGDKAFSSYEIDVRFNVFQFTKKSDSRYLLQ